MKNEKEIKIKPRFDSQGLPYHINYAYVTDPGDPSVGIWEHQVQVGGEDQMIADLMTVPFEEKGLLMEHFRDKLKEAFQETMDSPYIQFDFELEDEILNEPFPQEELFIGGNDCFISDIPHFIIKEYHKEFRRKIKDEEMDFADYIQQRDHRIKEKGKEIKTISEEETIDLITEKDWEPYYLYENEK